MKLVLSIGLFKSCMNLFNIVSKVLYSEEESSTAITLPNLVDLQGNQTNEKSLFQQRN